MKHMYVSIYNVPVYNGNWKEVRKENLFQIAVELRQFNNGISATCKSSRGTSFKQQEKKREKKTKIRDEDFFSSHPFASNRVFILRLRIYSSDVT